MKKRWLAILLVLTFSLSTVGVLAANPSLDDMIAVQQSGDLDALEALIRKEAEVTPSLNIDMTLAVGDVPRGQVNMDILGLQCEIRGDGSDFLEADGVELSDGYKYLAEELYGVPVARWGGTSTNYVSWWKNVGPLENRQDTYDVVSGAYLGGASKMGPVEFIKAIYATNPNAKFVFNIPLWGQTPEETRTFMHFLFDEKDASEYGALRASYGIEDPVEVMAFELGNENYFMAKYNATGNEEEGAGDDGQDNDAETDEATQIAYAEEKSKVYTDRCIEHIDEVRKDFPDVKFYANVSGGHRDRLFADPWTRGIAQNLDSRIDGLVFHDYYNNPGNVTGDFAEMDHIQSVYAGVAGHSTEFLLTEHSIWSSGNTVLRRSHRAALTEAAYINNLLWRDDIICANYHNFTGTHWSILRKFGTKYAPDSVNYVYRMYASKLGTQLLDAHKSEDASYVHALATRRDNGQVVLALVNGYQDRMVNITFAFNQAYDLVFESIYTAPNDMSFLDMYSVADVFSVTEEEKDVQNIQTYTLPNKSVVFLTLESHKDTQILIQDDFDSYDVMDTAVTFDRTAHTQDIIGDWEFAHQSGTSYLVNNTTVQVQQKFPSPKDRRVTLTASLTENTDKRLVLMQRKNVGDVLEGDFTLEYKMYKPSVVNGSGVRFMVHNDGKNYYQLWLGGNQEEHTWTFAKVVNNEVVASLTGDRVTQYNANPGGQLHNDQWIRIQKTGNTVSWEILGTRYNQHQFNDGGTYIDDSPFSVAGKNPTFGFAVNHSATPSNHVYLDDVSVTNFGAERTHQATETRVFAPRTPKQIEKNQADADAGDTFVANGEPDDVIYASLSGTQTENVLKLEKAYPIRKLVNKGDTAATVYVSRDDYSYEKLAELAPGETFANTLTAKEYSYIKTEGGRVKAYTALSDIAYLTPYRDMPTLLARINGADVPDATFAVSDPRLAKVEGNVLAPIATGQIAVTANGAVSSNIYIQEMETFTEDFSSYGNTETVSTPLGWVVTKQQIAGDWYLTKNGSTVNSNPTAYIRDGALHISGASISLLSGSLSYVVYDKPLPGLSEDYTISFTGNKVSVTSGMAIKFHMHDDNASFYQLSFGGSSDENYVWRFDKYENGVPIAEATVLGPTFATTTTDNNGSMHNSFDVTVRVNNGEISWTIDGQRYNKRDYQVSASYTTRIFARLPRRMSALALLSTATITDRAVTAPLTISVSVAERWRISRSRRPMEASMCL